MNMDVLEGNWKQLKGKIIEKWGRLTSDDLNVIAGKREALVGKLQKTYGYAREMAEREVKEFERNIGYSDQDGADGKHAGNW